MVRGDSANTFDMGDCEVPAGWPPPLTVATVYFRSLEIIFPAAVPSGAAQEARHGHAGDIFKLTDSAGTKRKIRTRKVLRIFVVTFFNCLYIV